MPKQRIQIVGAAAGFLAVTIFIVTFVVHSSVVEGFDPLNDYFSKLGAHDRPGALYWNIPGFAIVGILFAVFGFSFGRFVRDAFAGTCMICCGLGFALGAIPAEMVNESSTLTKAHVVSICLSLASWCFGLARVGSLKELDSRIRNSANLAGALTVFPLAGLGLGLFSPPVGHRVLLLIIFVWTLFVSTEFLTRKNIKPGEQNV